MPLARHGASSGSTATLGRILALLCYSAGVSEGINDQSLRVHLESSGDKAAQTELCHEHSGRGSAGLYSTE